MLFSSCIRWQHTPCVVAPHMVCVLDSISIEIAARRCVLVDQAQEFDCSYLSISVDVECERHQRNSGQSNHRLASFPNSLVPAHISRTR